MACWVVPTIAAELWGQTVEEVLRQIAEGTVHSKQEQGFIFVDAARHAVKSSNKSDSHPPTFTSVSEIREVISNLPVDRTLHNARREMTRQTRRRPVEII